MSNNDQKIKALMATVAEKKAALGTKPRASWKTNAVFRYDGSNYFNLNTVIESKTLVEALSFMLLRQSTTDKAGELLGVKVEEFEWNGYSISDWTEDFKTRLSILSWEAEKNKLNALETKLAALVSEEAKTEMELESITKSLQ